MGLETLIFQVLLRFNRFLFEWMRESRGRLPIVDDGTLSIFRRARFKKVSMLLTVHHEV